MLHKLSFKLKIHNLLSVANGQKMQSDGKCSDVQWEMQGYRFHFDLWAMELGAYDVVLGVDWMKSIGPFFPRP